MRTLLPIAAACALLSPTTALAQDQDHDGYEAMAGDCDDSNPNIHPDAIEICDGLDDNCDGVLLDGEEDWDGDGWYGCEMNEQPADCDDTDADVHPFAHEVCDGLDNDCDGELPESEQDEDGDGVPVCDGDCDDDEYYAHPGMHELCDGIDNDCDNEVDELCYEPAGAGDDPPWEDDHGCAVRLKPSNSAEAAALLPLALLLIRRRL